MTRELLSSSRQAINTSETTDAVRSSESTESEVEEGSSTRSPTHRSVKRGRRKEKRSSSDATVCARDDEATRSAVRSSVEAMLALVNAERQTEAEERGLFSNHGAEADAKKRKTTHAVRKEEIAQLTSEMQTLQKRLSFLQGQEVAAATEWRSDHDPVHPHIPNSLLREAVHEQQLNLACARSLISQFLEEEDATPIHCYLHLPKPRSARERIVLAMKPYQIRIARRYVLERSRHLNILSPHSAGERFINRHGDAINSRFSLVQFPGSLSVRDVFDAASFYTSNLEISFTDGAGRVTIREQEDAIDEPTMSQHHYLTTVNDRLQMEGNLVMVSHFDEQDDYGICATTYVDKDDLHPYLSTERIRQDITAVFMVSREKNTIVMRRMGHVRVHHNKHLEVSDALLLSLSEGLSQWGQAMVHHVRHQFGIKRLDKCTDMVLL